MAEADIAEQERALASLQLEPAGPVNDNWRQFRVWLLKQRGHPSHEDMPAAENGARIMADLRQLCPNDQFTREMIDGTLAQMDRLLQWLDHADTVWQLFEEAAVNVLFALMLPAQADAWMLGTIQRVVFRNLLLVQLHEKLTSGQIAWQFDIAARDIKWLLVPLLEIGGKTGEAAAVAWNAASRLCWKAHTSVSQCDFSAHHQPKDLLSFNLLGEICERETLFYTFRARVTPGMLQDTCTRIEKLLFQLSLDNADA